MCECVNIQYKRLEQLSGASPQTQPGFGFQLAAGSFRGPKQHWRGGGSPALHASLTSRAMLGGRPIRHHCLGPLQLAAFISAQVQHEICGCECKEPKASTLVFFHQEHHTFTKLRTLVKHTATVSVQSYFSSLKTLFLNTCLDECPLVRHLEK